MCTIKSEAGEDKATIGRVESECGGIDVVRLGANTEQEDTEPPTPKRSIRALPKLIKEEVEDEVKVKVEDEDDPLLYLAQLFSIASLDEDSGDEDDPDESVPSSPQHKGIDKDFVRDFDKDRSKYCFYASARLYYFDDFRNVYSQDGMLVSDGSSILYDDLLTPNFHIDGVPYWFEGINGLLYQTADGILDRVHIWQSDATPFDLGQMFDPTIVPTIFRPEASPELYYNSSSSPALTWASNGEHGAPNTKSETSSPPMTRPLQQTLHQGAIQFPWSPTSSTKSPIASMSSRETSLGPSGGPSLFGDSPGIQMVAKWHEDTAQAQQDALKARPTKKPCKEERRRCPICNKMFRRPSSLEDHLNVHSGDKPHTCAFKGCNTGFATKSNMKRHFLTHRVGPLEQYRPGVTPTEPCQSGKTKSGRTPRAPTATYNSKAHHTLRFRVAA